MLKDNTNAQLLGILNHLQEELNFLIGQNNCYGRMTKTLTSAKILRHSDPY